MANGVAVAAYAVHFVREVGCECVDKAFVAHCVAEFASVAETYHVEAVLVQLEQFQLVGYAVVFEILVHYLPFAETAHIVYAGVEYVAAAPEGLETASQAALLFEDQHLESFPAQGDAAGESTETGTYYYNVIFLHFTSFL